MKYMLDTNICSYAVKNNPVCVAESLEKNILNICISAVTFAELQYGIRKVSGSFPRFFEDLIHFLAYIPIIDFDRKAGEEYGKIRAYLEKQGTPIGYHDMLIAAHARALGLTVVTHNVREFERVPGLAIEDWYYNE